MLSQILGVKAHSARTSHALLRRPRFRIQAMSTVSLREDLARARLDADGERKGEFTTLSGEPIRPLYGPGTSARSTSASASRASIRSPAACTRACTAAGCGRCAVRRLRHGGGDERALPLSARPRADRAQHGVRPAVADGPRLRPSALARRGRPRGRRDRHARRHADAVRRDRPRRRHGAGPHPRDGPAPIRFSGRAGAGGRVHATNTLRGLQICDGLVCRTTEQPRATPTRGGW